ncbi:MAG: hypothetical protein H0Z33_05490 [Bacillaceae bacterium]|nr:hypothetical protein [Bacillaceae bacterium]
MQCFIDLGSMDKSGLQQRFPWFSICDGWAWGRYHRDKETTLYVYEENGKNVAIFLLQEREDGSFYIPYIYWNPECKPGSYAHFLQALKQRIGKQSLTCASYSVQPLWAVRMQRAGFKKGEGGTVQLLFPGGRDGKIEEADWLEPVRFSADQPDTEISEWIRKVMEEHKKGELRAPLLVQVNQKLYQTYKTEWRAAGFYEMWFHTDYGVESMALTDPFQADLTD